MRLTLDPRARAILARLPRANVYTLAELALLTLLAVQLARIVWALATPLGPVGAWRPSTQLPAGDPIARLTAFDPFFRLGPDTGSAVLTGLQLTLYGTRIDEATGRGSAILAGPDGVQASYAVGDEIVPGATLKAVQFDHVTIRRGGADETLYIDQSGGGATDTVPTPGIDQPSIAPVPSLSAPQAPAAPPAGVDPRRARPPVSSVDAVMREAALQPRDLGDGRRGLAISATSPALGAIGLNAGDVIVEAGGQPARSVEDLQRLVAGASGAVPVVVERNGQRVAVSVGVPR